MAQKGVSQLLKKPAPIKVKKKVADIYSNGLIFIPTTQGNTTIGGPLHPIEPYDDPDNPGYEIYQMGAIGPNPVFTNRPKRKVKRKKTA